MKILTFALILIITLLTTLNGDFIISGENNPEEDLIYPKKILEGPDKNIYIYDSQDAFIKVFSPEGKFLRKIGGKGEGPGQFKRSDAADFGFTPDGRSIYFTEFFRGHKWITFLDPDGKLKKTLKYNFTGNYGVLRSFIHNEEMIFLQRERSGKEIRKGDIYYAHYISELIIMNSKGRETTIVLTRENPSTISFVRRGGDTGIPFNPLFLWGITKRGNVLFTDGTKNYLKLLNRQGKLLKNITIPVAQAQPVTKKDLDEWRTRRKEFHNNRNRSWYKEFGSVIEKYTNSIFKYKPSILGMQITPTGNILLQCRTEKEDLFDYLLTDDNGKLLVKLTSPFFKIKITKSYIIVRLFTDDEETKIFIMNRQSSEEKDLTKVESINM